MEKSRPDDDKKAGRPLDPFVIGILFVGMTLGCTILAPLGRSLSLRSGVAVVTVASLATCASALNPGLMIQQVRACFGGTSVSQKAIRTKRDGANQREGGGAEDDDSGWNRGIGTWEKQKASSLQMPLLFPAARATDGATRVVHCEEAVGWMQRQERIEGSIFTSLPDIIEVGLTGREDEYKAWFMNAAKIAMDKISPGSYALFYQTDIKVTSSKANGKKDLTEWLDKSYLCSKAAEQAGCHLMWRKYVSKGLADMHHVGTPSFTHLICFGKGDAATYDPTKFNTPDLLPRGLMLWPRAIGVDAAVLGTRFLRDVVGETRVVDPFCGLGTILAAANALGLHAEGVDMSAAKCDRAMRLTLEPYLFGGTYSDANYRGNMAKLRPLNPRGDTKVWNSKAGSKDAAREGKDEVRESKDEVRESEDQVREQG